MSNRAYVFKSVGTFVHNNQLFGAFMVFKVQQLHINILNIVKKFVWFINTSVSDPGHCVMDPDPTNMKIRVRILLITKKNNFFQGFEWRFESYNSRLNFQGFFYSSLINNVILQTLMTNFDIKWLKTAILNELYSLFTAHLVECSIEI